YQAVPAPSLIYHAPRSASPATASQLRQLPILLDFPRKTGHNRAHCCVFVASLYSHLLENTGTELGTMSVRRRTWTNRDGTRGEACIVVSRAHAGTRRTKAFDKKRNADAYHKEVWVDVRKGIHTADSASITVAEAGRQWIEGSISAGLERATI